LPGRRVVHLLKSKFSAATPSRILLSEEYYT
jgi:hypothetical protein